MKSKYIHIQKALFGRLKDGTYPVDSRLPTEQELAEEFEVNRHTLRRAISLLVDEGYIDRAPRRGCVVLRHPGQPPAGERQTITWYQSSELLKSQAAEIETITTAFSEAHPEYELVIATYPRGTNLIPILPDASDHRGPCLVSLAYGANYASQGLLTALDSFADFYTTAKPLEGRLIQELAGPDGQRHVFMLPRCMGVWMMIANRSLLRTLGLGDVAPPKTWDELRELGEAIALASHGEVELFDLEFHIWPQSFARFTPWFLNANDGRQIIDPETGAVRFDTPENRRLLRYFKALQENGLATTRSAWEGFVKRRSVIIASLTQVGVARAGEWVTGDDMEAWAFPSPTPAHSRTLIRGEFVAIMDQSLKSEADREAAWTFLRFLISKELQQKIGIVDSVLPVRMDASFVIDPSSAKKHYHDYGMTYGQPMFDVIRHDDVHHVLCTTVARYLGGGDLDYLMSQAQELLEHYMSDRPAPKDEMAMAAEAFA